MGWSVEIFFIGQNRSSNQRSSMNLEVQIYIFRRAACADAHASKFSFPKKFHGAQILVFLVKIGMKLPFALKNKRRKTNLQFEFQKLLFWTPKKVVFEEKPPRNLVLHVLVLIQL